MARYCNNCGTELTDDAVFCLNCGVAAPTLPAQPASEPEPRAPEVPESDDKLPESAPGKNRKFPVKGLCISIAVIVALTAVFMIFSIFFARPYQDAVDDYVRLFLLHDLENAENAAPEEYWDWLEDTYRISTRELIRNAESITGYEGDFYKEFVGENLRFSYDFKIVNQYSRHQVEMMAESLEDHYNIDARTVTDAYFLHLDVTVEGENGNMVWDNLDLYLIEIDGQWYSIFHNIMIDGNIYVQFSLRNILYL